MGLLGVSDGLEGPDEAGGRELLGAVRGVSVGSLGALGTSSGCNTSTVRLSMASSSSSRFWPLRIFSKPMQITTATTMNSHIIAMTMQSHTVAAFSNSIHP